MATCTSSISSLRATVSFCRSAPRRAANHRSHAFGAKTGWLMVSADCVIHLSCICIESPSDGTVVRNVLSVPDR